MVVVVNRHNSPRRSRILLLHIGYCMLLLPCIFVTSEASKDLEARRLYLHLPNRLSVHY